MIKIVLFWVLKENPLDSLLESRWEGRNKESHKFRIKDNDQWRIASIFIQTRSQDGTRCWGVQRSCIALVYYSLSPLLCICTFYFIIFTSVSYLFFSPWFLGILFTLKYQGWLIFWRPSWPIWKTWEFISTNSNWFPLEPLF